MDHYRPHPTAAFEGYYSKFALPSGSHLIVIICSVRHAQRKPHMLSFTYVPPPDTSLPVFQRQLWVQDIHMRPLPSSSSAFELRIPELGALICNSSECVTIDLEHSDFSFHCSTNGPHTHWHPSNPSSTPAGLLTYFPLPLQWHVHSRSTPCTFALSIPSPLYAHLSPLDTSGAATVHLEKNWGRSFPTAHIWLQGFHPVTNRGICVAGGKILGMQAFLIGYVDGSKYSTSFTPPFSLEVFGLSPFLSKTVDWGRRTVEIDVSGLTQRLRVRAQAPQDGWFELAAPHGDGHRPGDLAERFGTKVEVEVWERGYLGIVGIGDWKRVRREEFEGSLEFAGEYYKKDKEQ